MKKIFTPHSIPFYALVLFSCVITSCKKDNTTLKANPLAVMGLFELSSGSDKRIYIPIAKVGTLPVNYDLIFDTGSSGMTLDAHGVIPDNMITTTGITFTGDSVIVNGITIIASKQQLVMAYGDNTSSIKEYGYLAYANVTMGNTDAQLTTRIPFFLYYKAVDGNGNIQTTLHQNDVFGVGPGNSYASTSIASPLSYFTMPANVTNGFKLADLGTTNFSSTGAYIAGLVTVGLVPNDLNSAGFILHPLTYTTSGGYSPNIAATIKYNTTTITGNVLFDTGTSSVTVIEDKNAMSTIGPLPVNSTVTITTSQGFVYTYTTNSTSNLTKIQNPNLSGDTRTIFSLDFFQHNEYLTDYTNHQIGLKNN